MVSYKKGYNNFPICDTNILINFGIINILEDFVEHKKKIYISDFVEKELERKFKESDNYKFLIENVRENNNINVLIKEELFSEDRIAVMNANLNEFGLRNNSFLTNTLCENIGEFTNAIYAVNLGIKEFISHDKKFINRYKNEEIFKSLRMKNMVQAIDSFLGKEKRKELIGEIKEKNSEMEDKLREETIMKKVEKWKLKVS
ncbi:hypothetical protein [Clostridium perfringens]|uniref:hypothetical protein n=1 Tax=Clostridium perfringens TaxID=1502 RepID=UPI0024BCC8A3|nr:hypothetical protein [Clostridium perfringens]